MFVSEILCALFEYSLNSFALFQNVQVNKITKALSEAYEYLEDSVSGMMKKVVDKDEKEL